MERDYPLWLEGLVSKHNPLATNLSMMGHTFVQNMMCSFISVLDVFIMDINV